MWPQPDGRPGVERATTELAGRLKVVNVNVDDAPGVSARFEVLWT